MPTVTELIISLVSMTGLGLLVSEKGSRLWAVGIALSVWLLAQFSVVALAFVSAWYELVA